MSEKKTVDTLRRLFRLAIKDDPANPNSSGGKVVHPGKIDDHGRLVPINFPSDVTRAYNYFLSNYSVYNTNRDRWALYKDLDFMIKNEGLMSTASMIYQQETYEIQAGGHPIEIIAKERKVEKEFYSWLESIGFNGNYLSEIAGNLVDYGDAFWINAYDSEKGIVGFTMLDPFLVKDKLEFNLGQTNKVENWSNSYLNITNKTGVLSDLLKTMKDDGAMEDYSLYYQSYNLGYLLKFSTDSEDELKAVPPWAITHFKLFSSSSEFFPFGRPLFINSIARYRSYKTTEMLIDMLRVASFPREIVEIQGNETMTPLDRVQRVNEVREFIENISPVTNNRDNIGVGERLYAMEGIFTFRVDSPDIDMDKLGDLEAKRSDLILSTGIPDTILIPSSGGGLGGENASALYYNNKIFQRRVEAVKSAIMEGIAFAFRVHLAIIGKYDGEATEFELNMPVNSEMYTSEKLSQDQDSLRLATDILSNLGQALGLERGQMIPEPVVRDVFKHFLSVDHDVIDRWITQIKKGAEEQADDSQETDLTLPLIIPTGNEEGPDTTNKEKPKKPEVKKESYTPTVRKFYESWKAGDDGLIREAYFKAKRDIGMTGGWLGKRVFFNNSYTIKENSEKSGAKYSLFGTLREAMVKEKRSRLREEEKQNDS